ncbi:dynamin-like GTPase OPA1, mitochondrial isoform X2 [Halyomorpha halys]|uniref:dynamin-like GTPase OPA1, mitochondrial isoform X2 n=1 Tax=Halyomorpha halys TaxID=286706 RepID=UPI0006D50277|nr:dynamin-like 120 kDa protein, mitochondrial isoform X2 [Halyomorpha halys]
MYNFKGRFGFIIVQRGRNIPILSVLKAKHGLLSRNSKNYSQFAKHPKLLQGSRIIHVHRRGFGMFVARFLKGALKLRYLVLGGAVGGGMTLQNKYQAWKDSLPDLSWLDTYLPSTKTVDSFRESMISLTERVKDIEIDPKLMSVGETKWRDMQEWLNKRIDEAYEAAKQSEIERASNQTQVKALSFGKESAQTQASTENTTNNKRIDALQQELMDVQLRYQREIERLERDNKELKKQILLNKHSRSKTKQIKKSLIDMYSEVLDELSDYDSSYSVQDQLPRVVVVGDQSSGKTSVLEMIAQARIFPRGAGEMMTRAPVKVTLSEGPYHVAQFKDSDREFDLSKEEDLAKLRLEVELRMKRSLGRGKSVSNEVISMTVKGPGLQRMVLVDLPGIISTVTREMAEDTKEAIRRMTQIHMSNPNAIILCVQDGSVDAERSNVTDLVASIDPSGKRTIFVLTKVDMAEESLADPQRINKILSGKLFPMKALGYFAVVTGRGRKEDAINDIKLYEENFFRTSKLFRESMLSSTQLTTRNLSMAVSECFWKMVRETVEQQADAFKATRFNLETEWKNTFPRLRELDRDELFEKARSEILDEVINLSQVSVKEWDSLLLDKLWQKVSHHVLENIYLPAAQTCNSRSFNTTVDIRLKEWAESQLADKSIEAGSEALKTEFSHFIDKSMANKESDKLFDNLKRAVLEEALKRHSWEEKGNEVLRMLQVTALEDRCVNDKHQWDSAVKFLEKSLKERLELVQKQLTEMFGPGAWEKWVYWKSTTSDQKQRNLVKSELEKLLYSDFNHGPTLNPDEMTTIRKNIQRSSKTDISNDFIRDTWAPIYRHHFLNARLGKAYDCRKAFYLYHQGLEELECNDVVLFWRMEQMLKVTANALRQQVMNREARRLDKIIKEVLEDYSQDQEKKISLLTGRRVTLAEELKRVRQIQDKLEEFIQALNKEK